MLISDWSSYVCSSDLLRLGIPRGPLLDGLDPVVAAAYDAALKLLGGAGVRLTDEPLALLSEVAEVNARGGLTAAEAFFIHRAWMDSKASEFAPLVYSRVDRGRAIRDRTSTRLNSSH